MSPSSLISIRPTCLLSLALLGALACKTAEPTDDGDDQPAVPIEAEDAAQVLAEQICAQMYTCECPNNIEYYANQTECVIVETSEIQNAIDGALANGGTWDPVCAGDLAKALRDWECMGQTMAMRESTFSPVLCPVLKGSGGLANECYQTALGDTCQAGLTCLEGVCIETPTLPVPSGQQCYYGYVPCAAGTYCDWHPSGDGMICQDLPVAGEACNPNDQYLCGPQSEDLICDIDSSTCIPSPGEGESCEEYTLCQPGLYCDGGKGFTCQPRQELGEGCGGDPVCPVDASCVNSICTADPAAVCNAYSLF